MSPKVALVTGGNGISGNAIVEHLIRQPESQWSKIIVTSNSPLKAQWQDYRVKFIAINYLEPLEKIIERIRPHCADVTHAYFCSYIHNADNDFDNLWQKNVPLFENFLVSIDTVAANTLQRVCLQTGGKHYGVHQGAMFAPISEEHTPRWEDGANFYHPQEDLLFDLQKQRKWGWNVIRPQAIIGYTPGASGMTAALKLVQYLIICRENGSAPRFPGNEMFYNFVDDFSYAPSIADMTIWATTQEHTKNEAFNHANGDVICWKYFYPRIANYLGMTVPDDLQFTSKGTWGGKSLEFKMLEWAADKKPVWDSICQKYGGKPESFDWGAWAYFDWASSRNWLTLMSLSKARKMGWLRYDDSYDTWVKTIRAFENAGVLPDHARWETPQPNGLSH